VLTISSAAERATAVESRNCANLHSESSQRPNGEAIVFEMGPFSARWCSTMRRGECSALGDTNQHFLTTIQRDLLTSVESRGS
jgi:hypothetical protein